MPNKITASYRIVTPMFIGDANQNATEITPQSVKGALRFWWRALQWGTFRENSNDIDALRQLHQREAELFGGLPETVKNKETGKDETKGGQGAFLLRVAHHLPQHTNKSVIHPKFKDYAAARYLGYGLMVAFGNNGGQLIRGCLNENQEFTVELLFKGNIDSSIQNALIALGLLGSLGSRSRHGMGSVALVSFKVNGAEQWTMPTDTKSYDACVKKLFSCSVNTRPLPAPLAPFSAFWEYSRIDRLLFANNCYSVLDDFGKAMLRYRSWGSSQMGNVLAGGGGSEKRFDKDHDWYRVADWAARNPSFHPERVVFGLPHNYHQTHHHVNGAKHERRSSPLLFHVHPVGTGFVGISIYLPAQFLPSGEQIKANDKPVPVQIDWTVITNFLDGKVGNPPAPNAPDRFPLPHKMAVLP